VLRGAPTRVPLEPASIALGLCNALRALAGAGPVLIAIDDVHWLDAPSADALAFAARRMQGEPAAFLLARRASRRSGLEQALEPRLTERIEAGALSERFQSLFGSSSSSPENSGVMRRECGYTR
jgi:hypothetical protein